MGRTAVARLSRPPRSDEASWDEMFESKSSSQGPQPRKSSSQGLRTSPSAAYLKAYKITDSQWRKGGKANANPYTSRFRSVTPASNVRKVFDFDQRASLGPFATSYTGSLTPQPRRSRAAATRPSTTSVRPSRTSIRPKPIPKPVPKTRSPHKKKTEKPGASAGDRADITILTNDTSATDTTPMDTDSATEKDSPVDEESAAAKRDNALGSTSIEPARGQSRASTIRPSASKMLGISPLRNHPRISLSRTAQTRSLPTLNTHARATTAPAMDMNSQALAEPKRSYVAGSERMRTFRKENNDFRRRHELKDKYLMQAEQKRYVRARIKFPSRREEYLAREKAFGTHAQKEHERKAKVEAGRRAAQLRVLSVDKCFDISALRARRARELMEKELQEFNHSLPSKEAIKAQEAAAFRAGLNILRASKAKKLGDSMAKERKRRAPTDSMLCLRLSAHNLPVVPDARPTMSNLFGGLVQLHKNDKMKGFSQMVKNQHDKEAAPPVENPAHRVDTENEENVMKAMHFNTRKPRTICAIYQRSMRAELKNYWYLLGKTGLIAGSSPDFNIYFNFVHLASIKSDHMDAMKTYSAHAMHDEGRQIRVRLYDMNEDDTVAHVMGSADFEVSRIQDAVDEVITVRQRDLTNAKHEAERLSVPLLQHMGGDARLKRMKEKWVQLMFPVEYPESSELTAKMEDSRCRISLHCKNLSPTEILDVASVNLEHPYERHVDACEHNPDGIHSEKVAEKLNTVSQLYFEPSDTQNQRFALERTGHEDTQDLLNFYCR